jgi:hypothetical protein
MIKKLLASITAGMANTVNEGGDEGRPDQERHAVQRHPGHPLLADRDDQLHRNAERRQLAEGDHLRPDVGALARGVLGPRERNVAEPAGVGAEVQDKGDVDHRAPEQEYPVVEGGEARKGDLPRADHQRHEVDGHGLHDRHGEQEHHGRAV